ncbi:uncharacterized protein FOMMEDRAFT_146241 [Fomitiporia mediterranea MF3/22]|uniref:uncharacterized protein n=1 Tax=Fomitiporia mediterranea (strain MF3/22) TaxID=694068 RepID=UPI0004409B6F|nr:uncharacterized protein FOMMEDRAFT_146241 [Fomitiporia mediterranea MF3/22]EJD04235.1 hypothetical protein FOMMEDRAFT_146241 [Fomitiporia mediterranea MF3/22]
MAELESPWVLLSLQASGAISTTEMLPDGPPTTASTVTLDPTVMRSYLLALLPPILGVEQSEFEDQVFDAEFEERVARFACEGGSPLCIVKRKVEAEGNSPQIYRYQVTSTLTYSPAHVLTVLLIKRSAILDPRLPLAQQLHVINLFGDDGEPYENLHSVISRVAKPWYEAFVGAQCSGKDGYGKLGIPIIKKRFAKLESSLLLLHQNVEIPEVHLTIHPVIQRVVEQAHAQNVGPKISFIPSEILNDAAFLYTLESHSKMWMKSIQAVTQLSRDVSSRTASQEINFWLGLEQALEAINGQLRNDEVNMTIECLRNAKRLDSAAAFVADTGLCDAMDVARRYNTLMQDFPLNELYSASDIKGIGKAVRLIFRHFNRKFKGSSYPVWRALSLIEAISGDFNATLLRVLASSRLADQSYSTFDRLMSQTMDVFRIWDDEIKDLKCATREVLRRRAERFVPIKIRPAHAKLRERIRCLRELRREHYQLATMTNRKLCPGTMRDEHSGIDMQGVKEAYEIIKKVDILDVSTEGTKIWTAVMNAYKERVALLKH